MKIESDILKTAAVVLLLIGAYVGLVFWPSQKQSKSLAQEIKTKQAELDQMKVPNLSPVRSQIASLSAELSQRSVTLPEGDLDDRVLHHVSDTLIEQGVTQYETAYREPKFFKRFAVTPIDVSFNSGFAEAYNIIRQIENSGPPVRIERLELAGEEGSTSGHVGVSMQLSSFFLPTDAEGGLR